MKIDSKGLIPLQVAGNAVLVDIRFEEAVATWRMGFGMSILLNELPARLTEIPKDKIIVTACPHKDRSVIAMTCLRARGYDAKYLTDNLTGQAETLLATRVENVVSPNAGLTTLTLAPTPIADRRQKNHRPLSAQYCREESVGFSDFFKKI